MRESSARASSLHACRARQSAKVIEDDGDGDALRIKGERPTLRAEVKRILVPRAGQPEATSPWERMKGREIQQRLVRSGQTAGSDGWTRSRQAWLVQTVAWGGPARTAPSRCVRGARCRTVRAPCSTCASSSTTSTP